MRLLCPLLLCALLATAARAQPRLGEQDRVRLAEAFRLADDVQDAIWPAWSDVPFAVLLVTPEHEFLVRHPRPSDDFALVADYDSLLQSAIYARDRQFAPGLLATFPAVGGVPTVVVGQAEQTGTSSTFWVVTLLHEHFHQFQMSQPGYFDAVEALDLSGGDETGMWMLDYPFPYESPDVGERFDAYRVALQRALAEARGPGEASAVRDYAAARTRLRAALSAAADRYLSFQVWQEGVARYTEHRVAESAAERHQPSAAFQALSNFVPYTAAADSLRHALASELSGLRVASDQRVAFYALGAAEAFLLDAVRPGWRRRYFSDPFDVEQAGARR